MIDQEFKAKVGDMVVILSDPDKLPRMVTAVTIRSTYNVYGLSLGSFESWHQEIEFQKL